MGEPIDTLLANPPWVGRQVVDGANDGFEGYQSRPRTVNLGVVKKKKKNLRRDVTFANTAARVLRTVVIV